MKKNSFVLSALVLCASALAYGQAATAPAPAGPAPNKVAIINITNAILSTNDGKAAASALQAKFAPKQEELQKRQQEIASLRDQLAKGSATMSQEAKDKLMRDIDTNTKTLNRLTEDAQADLDQEQGKVQQDLGGKIMSIIEQYAVKNGVGVVIDVSNPQTPVLWAAMSLDITNDVVKLYDQAHPSTAAPATAAAPAARPAAPAGVTPSRPAAPAAPKK